MPSHYPQRGERGGRRPPSERQRGPEGTESTEQSLKESEEIQILYFYYNVRPFRENFRKICALLLLTPILDLSKKIPVKFAHFYF